MRFELLRSSGGSDRAYGERGKTEERRRKTRELEVVADEDEGCPVVGVSEGVFGEVAFHVESQV